MDCRPRGYHRVELTAANPRFVRAVSKKRAEPVELEYYRWLKEHKACKEKKP